jgi:uncharacterized protein
MKIEFDPIKNSINYQKHGVYLADADSFEWESAIVWQDVRYDYQEPRMVSLGYIDNRLFCMVFVDRAETCRIISSRKANNREIKCYAST